MRHHARGFTLIEMAIVLAVITIVVSGLILTGESVLSRAAVANLMTSIKDLAAASRDFKARYGYFPGDMPNAGTYITTNGGISTGCNYAPSGQIGNGLVDTSTESNCALEHLVKAGALSKVDYDGTQYAIRSTVAPNVSLSLWYDSTTNTNAVRVSNLPCDIALELDNKLDSATTDDTPFKQGAVIAQDASGTSIPNCIPSVSNDPVSSLLIKY